MRIGFDAKRAFFNFSGLGNYSRNTIICLSEKFPDNDYHLYIPKRRLRIHDSKLEDHHLEYPESFIGRKLNSFWRSYWLGRRLVKDSIDIYHGLSNEIPFGLPRQEVRSVVTIHDLIFIRFPEWYKPIDRKIYTRKAEHACRNADRIIAISEQSKSDMREFLGTPEEKIDVVYQGCDSRFYYTADRATRDSIRQQYNLPSEYLLYVGTIEPRKNLLNVVKALHEGSIDIPLVVIGRATPYLDEVRQYIRERAMEQVIFLKEVPNDNLPAIYQMASVFLYPSKFEGFGIPILEALASGVPVITSRGGVFPEAGGPDSLYIDPESPEEIAVSVHKILDNSELYEQMSKKGLEHAAAFTGDMIASNIMKVYQKIL